MHPFIHIEQQPHPDGPNGYHLDIKAGPGLLREDEVVALLLETAVHLTDLNPELREPRQDDTTQLLVSVKWHGDYYAPSERADMVRAWIESALTDRDDSPAATITELPATITRTTA